MTSWIQRLLRRVRARLLPTGVTAAYSRPWHSPLEAPGSALSPQPLVSIIMTCHNASAFIEKAASSILSQSWKHIELIVVDDASTDNTASLVRAMADADPRVRCLFLECNKGTYVAKNHGIMQARGEAITFMDSDDCSAPERIERQLAALRQAGAASSSCNYVRVTVDGDELLNRGLRERRALVSLMVKRVVFDEIGLFDSVRTSADDEFFERVRLVYGRHAHRDVPIALYFALARSDSLSGDERNRVSLDTEQATQALSPQRQAYVQAYTRWHRQCTDAGRHPFMPFPAPHDRPFPAGKD